jgi:lysophospholipase L1-like esterase
LPADEAPKPVTVQDGDRIIFLGDSLTYLGGKEEPKQHVTKGYVRIVRETLQQKHKDIEVDWASTGGGTVQTLLSLLDKDVLPKKPTIVVVQIGCNDARGSTKEKFESGLEELIDRLRKAQIHVVQCTCTSVGEKHDGANPADEKLEAFAEAAREVAKRKKVPLIDLRKAFVAYWKKNNPDNKATGVLTYDGNHFNQTGMEFVATQMLKMLQAPAKPGQGPGLEGQGAEAPPDAVDPRRIVRDRYAMEPPHFSKDRAVKIDYDIVYVRAPHNIFVFPDVGTPTLVEPGADLMLLHPDGSEERLVEGGQRGSVADPFVSFDGKSVYYAFFYASHGADIYKIHVPSRQIVRLTHDGGRKAPGTLGASYAKHVDSQVHLMTMMNHHPSVRDVIYNTGPCPVPGGKVVFTSNRNGFVPRLGSFSSHAFQLTVMDEEGTNVETIGHLNLGCALHPVILSDGRIMFSSLENQGLRNTLHWSVWTIRPDGSHWNPLVSDFGWGLPPSFHFQTQRSDGRAVVEFYYNVNQAGFGTYAQFPVSSPKGVPFFGPGDPDSPRNRPLSRLGASDYQLPFSPYGLTMLTPFANDMDNPSPRANPKDPKSAKVGRVTHPCGAPDNHVLTVWAPDLDVSRDGVTGGVRRVGGDTGIYLIKAGQPVYEPGQMVLIKNDPNYHELWPRPLVPYQRVHGRAEPERQPLVANDGKSSPHLPEGTPYGLIGTSSLYKRESATAGVVPEGQVTAVRPTESGRYRRSLSNWVDQGADAGIYDNSEIHAIRIVLQEPNVREDQWRFHNHARERMRILGEIPVRHFANGKQPLDPDGNPDTSFLAKIPADHSFTFQTLDKHGMVLNMAQTWHQVRPGEIRHDCGGCHAHSQKPTLFEHTASARPDYKVFDLTSATPLLTDKSRDESHRQWDAKDETGLRFQKRIQDVEYWRHVRPILRRSCAACHGKDSQKPAAGLVLDDDETNAGEQSRLPRSLPQTYKSLALDPRFVTPLQARASLLTWKLFGRRMDGLADDSPWFHAPAKTPSRPFKAASMPPAAAVTGAHIDPDGKNVKVAPLTDEDRRTLIRWIDLGCSIDLRFDPDRTDPGTSPFADRTLPTLAVAYPRAGSNQEPLSRIVIGMADAVSGLDVSSFSVTADFTIDKDDAGRELASNFRHIAPGVWEMRLRNPIHVLERGKLTIQIADQDRNVSRIERTFSIAAE